MRKLIIASTSTIYGSGYLEYLLPTLTSFFEGVATLLFIPYARPGGISYDAYTKIAAKAFATINIKVQGIHEFENPIKALQEAQAIFTGGGNTFELLNQLYQHDLITELKSVLARLRALALYSAQGIQKDLLHCASCTDYRNFKLDKPTNTNKIVMIQKRTTTWVSRQPPSSKWWCSGAIRKMRRPSP